MNHRKLQSLLPFLPIVIVIQAALAIPAGAQAWAGTNGFTSKCDLKGED